MMSMRNLRVSWSIHLLITISIFSLPAYAKYGGGSGTADDPYQIWTPEQMNDIGANIGDWDKHFKLMADIDLSGFDGKDGRPAYNLIGPDTDPATWDYDQYAIPFTGTFDGNGHTISHLTISGRGYIGLFCYLDPSAEVRDLGIVDVNITGVGRAVGGLAGYTRGALVIRSYSTGVVSSTGTAVGGLVGYNRGYMTHCFSEAKVHGTNYSVGGLVGESWGTITGCYSNGAVSGTGTWVGGLLGGNYSRVTQCYSTGPVSGFQDVGGLVGLSSGGIGRGDSGDPVTSSFWNTETSGQITSAGGAGKTMAEMQTAVTFLEAGWDFMDETVNGTEDIWRILEGQDYPRLWWEAPRAKYSGGSGDPNDPYQIATAEDLMRLGECPEDYDKHFILIDDIDLSPNLTGRKVFDKAVIAPDASHGEPFYQGIPFSGIFDGDNHIIWSLNINGKDYLGLFGRLGGASSQVRNVRLVNANVIGSGQCVGILVGDSHYGTVANCSSHGEVSGNFYIGGLVGYNVGTVTCCSAEVKVSGIRWSIGGLVGYNGAYVQQSYSTGNVTGNIWTGGLVGENGGTVTECYSTGRVWGTSDVGGLVGYDYDWSQADRCFWDTWTSGRSGSAGGTGKTTNELKRAATFTDWDFENIWTIFEGLTYPKLQWELGGPVSPVPTTIEKVSGDNQSGPSGAKLALPLMARVKDQNGEVMANVQVDFSITAGDGTVEPSSAVTDSDGIASTELTLGLTPGLNKVNATAANIFATFSATGVLPPEGYGGGHGIADDPYQIWTAEHMNAIGANPGQWDKHFKLMADIDLGAFIGARGKTFQMIGVHNSYGQPFSGVFDGNGKAISNFTVTDSDAASQGLFGAVQGTNAEIKNLRLVAVNVNAETRNIVGALVGYLHSGSISNCRVQGGSVSAMTWVGGLVGICGGTIVNCSSSANVSVSDTDGGGLIGKSERTSTITASFATGHVSGRAIVGGLIGENNGTIDNCYSTGQVSATKSMAGGLVASVGYPDGTIRNCYSTGRVSAPSPVGGLVGVAEGASVTGSFWDRQTSGQATSAGGTGKTTTEMKRAATFAGWDFENIWTIREGVDYPKLRWAEPSGSTPPAQANIITSVVRANGESDNRAPIGQYNGNTSPLPTQVGGLKDGNLCFSDRTYPWIRTPTQLVGAEYVRTFNSDKHSTTVTYTVTISREATVMITVDNRISNGQGAINQATARFAPSWMFVNSGLRLYIHENASTDTPLSVFSAELPAGTYVFSAVPSVHTFYIIAVMD